MLRMRSTTRHKMFLIVALLVSRIGIWASVAECATEKAAFVAAKNQLCRDSE